MSLTSYGNYVITKPFPKAEAPKTNLATGQSIGNSNTLIELEVLVGNTWTDSGVMSTVDAKVMMKKGDSIFVDNKCRVQEWAKNTYNNPNLIDSYYIIVPLDQVRMVKI